MTQKDKRRRKRSMSRLSRTTTKDRGVLGAIAIGAFKKTELGWCLGETRIACGYLERLYKKGLIRPNFRDFLVLTELGIKTL